MSDEINFDAKVIEEGLETPLFTPATAANLEAYADAPQWDGRQDYAEYLKDFAAWERANRADLRRAGIRGIS